MLEGVSFFKANPMIIPMSSEPNMLTANVPRAMLFSSWFRYLEIRYLKLKVLVELQLTGKIIQCTTKLIPG